MGERGGMLPRLQVWHAKRFSWLGPSNFMVLLVLVSWVWVYNNVAPKAPETRKQIVWDVRYYYAYLPAIFYEHDLRLEAAHTHRKQYHTKYLLGAPGFGTPEKPYVIKMSAGMAFFYFPGFLLAEAYNGLMGKDGNDGFSYAHDYFIGLVCLVWAWLGVVFLKRFLTPRFGEWPTFWALGTLCFATNLFFYACHEAAMSHGISFTLLCALLGLTERWHAAPRFGTTVLLAFLLGLATWVRPVNALFVLVPLLYGFFNPNLRRQKLALLRKPFSLAAALLAGFAPLFVQMLYWKHVSGSWVYYSYGNEPFFWADPELTGGFFSYRTGWLVYSPVMLLSLIGFVFLPLYLPRFRLPLLLFFVYSYTILCWWCWWYGGSFGQRAMIDIYGLLALPLAALIASALQRRLLKVALPLSILVFTAYNFFQVIQWRRGSLHYDANSKASYWAAFLHEYPPEGYHDLLEYPMYDEARKGIDEWPR